MLTPIEIENKEFKKGLRGYRDEEVDEFLDIIKEDYESLCRENTALKEKLGLYQDQVNKYQIIEQANNRVIEIRKEYDALVKEFKIFRNKFKSLLEDEIRSVDEIFYDVDEKCVNAFEGTTVYNYSNDEAATTLE